MKKRLAGILLALACLFALFGVQAVSASASSTVATGTQSATATLPDDLGGWKFWSTDICIEPGAGIPDDPSLQTAYRVAYLAQQWNLRTTTLALNYETDCAAAGYPPSRRMVVGLFDNPTFGGCYYSTNTGVSTVNGMKRWTEGPGMYVNKGIYGCVQDQTHRDHLVSSAIGWVLGAKLLNSSGYDSRVMNQTNWSWQNVPLPDQNTANSLDALYSYAYCQPFGTTC